MKFIESEVYVPKYCLSDLYLSIHSDIYININGKFIRELFNYVDEYNLIIGGDYLVSNIKKLNVVDEIDIFVSDIEDLEMFDDKFDEYIISRKRIDLENKYKYMYKYNCKYLDIQHKINFFVSSRNKDIFYHINKYQFSCSLAFYNNGRLIICSDINNNILRVFDKIKILTSEKNITKEDQYNHIKEIFEKYEKRGFKCI